MAKKYRGWEKMIVKHFNPSQKLSDPWSYEEITHYWKTGELLDKSPKAKVRPGARTGPRPGY